MLKDKRKEAEQQEQSRELEKQLVKLLWPVLAKLNQKLDRRLVSTLLGLVMAIVMHRHRNHGLLLSELGGYLLGAEHCRARTKRISNLVHHEKWEVRIIEDYFWQAGTQRVEELWEQGEHPLVIWDESVLEKPKVCVLYAPARQSDSNVSSLVFSIHRADDPFLCRAFTG